MNVFHSHQVVRGGYAGICRFIASTSYVLEFRFIAVAAFGDAGLEFGKRKEDAPGHPVSSAPRFLQPMLRPSRTTSVVVGRTC